MGNSTPAIIEKSGSSMMAQEVGRLHLSSLKGVQMILESQEAYLEQVALNLG